MTGEATPTPSASAPDGRGRLRTVGIVVAAVAGFALSAGIAYAAVHDGGSDATTDRRAMAELVEVPMQRPTTIRTGTDPVNAVVVSGEQAPPGTVVDASSFDLGFTAPGTSLGEAPPTVQVRPLDTVADSEETGAAQHSDPPAPVPIPALPSVIAPPDTEGSVEGDDTTPTDPPAFELAEFFDWTDLGPLRFDGSVTGVEDPCASADPGLDCILGDGATIVPTDLDVQAVDALTTDVPGQCDQVVNETPRDHFAASFRSVRPGSFRVTSVPSSAGALPDVVTVDTSAALTEAWVAGESVVNCVSLARDLTGGDAPRSAHYLVTIEPIDTATIGSPYERWLHLDPARRPEVRILPTGERTLGVAVTARSDEQVMVAMLEQGDILGDRCREVDPVTWQWPQGASALAPTETMPYPGNPRDPNWDPQFDTTWMFRTELAGSAPQALCVIWFDDFVPAPRVSERRSYSVAPPRMPGISLSLTELTTTDPDPLEDSDASRFGAPRWTPGDGVSSFRSVRDNRGRWRCTSSSVVPEQLPTRDCSFDADASFLRENTLEYSIESIVSDPEDIRRRETVAEAHGVLSLDARTCEGTVCTYRYDVTLTDPRDGGVVGTAVLAAVIDETTTQLPAGCRAGGRPGICWRIAPTGSFEFEPEAVSEKPQLDPTAVSLEADPTYPAARVVLRWRADRPAVAQAELRPLGDRCRDRAELIDPTAALEPAIEGTMVFSVPCPGTTYEASMMLAPPGALGLSGQSYGPQALALPNYPWPDNLVETAPLPLEMRWSLATRLIISEPERRIEVGAGRGEHIIEQWVGIRPWADYAERQANVFGSPRCMALPEFDTTSDGWVTAAVGPRVDVRFASYEYDFDTCYPVRNVAGGWSSTPVRYADYSDRSVGPWEMIRERPWRFEGSEYGGDGEPGELRPALEVQFRLADPRYLDILDEMQRP